MRTPRGGPYVVSCAGIESRRKTEREAQFLARLQEKRHDARAWIYFEANGKRTVVPRRSDSNCVTDAC